MTTYRRTILVALALTVLQAVAVSAPKLHQAKQTPPSARLIASAAFSPDGRVLATGGHGSVQIVSANGRNVIATISGAAGTVNALAFSPNGALLAAAGGEPGKGGEILLIDTKTWKVVRKLIGHVDAIYGIAFDPKGDRLVACSYDKLLSVWSISPGAKPNYLKDHTDSLYAVAWSPDGTLIASGGADRTVKLWDTASFKRLYTLSESTAEVQAVAFSPDGKRVAAGSSDKGLRTWNITHSQGALAKAAFAHDGPVMRIAYSRDGQSIVSAGEDNAVKVWDAVTLAEKRVLPKQPDWPHGLALSKDDRWIAVGRHDGSLAVYEMATGRLVQAPVKRKSHVTGGGADSSQLGRPIIATLIDSPSTQAAQQADAKKKDKPVPTTSRVPGTTFGKRDPIRPKGGVTLFAASLGAVDPVSVKTGADVRLTLVGGRINMATAVYFDDPAITGTIVAPVDPNQAIVRVDAKIGAAARTGLHRVYVQTPNGTTGSVVFAVYPWQLVAQVEPNNAIENAQPIPSECVVAGALDAPGDVDVFKVDAKSGEEIVFDCVAQPLRSRLQPVMTIIDSAGKALTESKQIPGRADAMLGYRFEKAGTYYLQLRDYESAGGGDVYYRLNVGHFPIVTEAFPLGIQRGQTAEVSVKGFNLGGVDKVKVTAPNDMNWGAMFGLPMTTPNGPLYATRLLAVSGDPEARANNANSVRQNAQTLPVPSAVNGVLSTVSAQPLSHYYRFNAKKGQRLVLDVMARRLGSKLDSEIEILDAQGKPVEKAILRAVFQSEVTLNDRDSSIGALRIFAWDGCHMGDTMLIGRELIKILRLPNGPDEDVFFRTLRGQRVGYMGTTPEFHSVGEKIYKVEVHPPGIKLSPNGYPLTKLYERNDDGSPIYGKDSALTFDPPTDGEYFVKLTDARGQTGPDFTYHLAIRMPQPDYRVSLGSDHINLPQGGTVTIDANCERFDGYDGPITVELTGLPAGFTATKTLIEGTEISASIQISASPEATTPATYSQPIRLIAKAMIGGKEIVRTVEPSNGVRLVTVMAPPDVRIITDRPEVIVKAGQEVDLEALIDRLGKYGGRIPIGVRNLPYGVRVQNIGLNGILVTEDDSARKFTLYCEPWVQPMERTIYVSADIEGGVSIGAQPVTLRIVK